MSSWIQFTAILLAVMAGCASSQGVYHSVQGGQTLFTISRIYGVDANYLARINGIEDPSRLRIGQQLFIPGADRERSVPVTVAAAPMTVETAAVPPATAITKTPSHPPAATTSPSKTKPPPPAPKGVAPSAARPRPKPPEKGVFIWPIRGEMVRSFGREGNQTCQGVEIAAPAGTPVLSAAAGRVTYSGNGIRGYGHLVILRHDGDFFTVYGFNQKSLVETGVSVRQGQRIALSGTPPGGGRPRLHFEIRQGKSPVNPIFYLP